MLASGPGAGTAAGTLTALPFAPAATRRSIIPDSVLTRVSVSISWLTRADISVGRRCCSPPRISTRLIEVDAEFGFDIAVEPEHLRRVAGALADQTEQIRVTSSRGMLVVSAGGAAATAGAAWPLMPARTWPLTPLAVASRSIMPDSVFTRVSVSISWLTRTDTSAGRRCCSPPEFRPA